MVVDDFASYRSDKFIEIVDVGLFEGYYNEMILNGAETSMNSGLALKVVQENGVEVTPNFNVKTTELRDGYKNFKANNDDTINFKIDVIIRYNETWGYGHAGKDYPPWTFDGEAFYSQRWYVTKWLEYWMKNMRPLYVVSDAIDVPNGTYLLTENSSRTQNFREYTVWTLEFTTCKDFRIWRWDNDNSAVRATIDSLVNPKQEEMNIGQIMATWNAILGTCTDIVYSKTQNYTDCNKLMQYKLYFMGYLREDQVDGWYGNVTMEAVKKFQRDYNNILGGNLLVDGICGPVTLAKLVSITW